MKLGNRVVFLHVLLAMFFTPGCAVRSDLRPGGDYPTDYMTGAVYRTKVVLVGQRQSWFHYPLIQRPFDVLALSPPGLPVTISEIEAGTKPYIKNFVVIPQGTLIRFERFVDQSTPVGRAIFPCGRILEGPFAGQEVILHQISRRDVYSNPRLYMVDPEFLELVKPY